MMTPYDWQEAVSQRAQHVEARLESGIPVVATSTKDGIVALTMRRTTIKIYEIYDRLMFAAIGLQSDVESVRVSSIEFAHREGFERSEHDVSIQRVVLNLSQPMKKAFNDFRGAPVIAKGLFMELGSHPEQDVYYVLDYDGDYARERLGYLLTGKTEGTEKLSEALASGFANKGADYAIGILGPLMAELVSGWVGQRDDYQVETALLRRDQSIDRHFYHLSGGPDAD